MKLNPKVTAGRRRRRWLRFGSIAILLVGGVILIGLQSCSMPGPKASAAQIAALPRENILAAPDAPRLSYLHTGDATAPRVIYIHGTPGSADGWADFLTAPIPGLEAIAIDRLGFGLSGGRDGGVDSFTRQAEAIAPLLVERQGRWPILVGHSLGGPIAARLAAMHPDKVGGLVIVAGSLDPAEEKPGLGQEIATTGLVRAILPQVLDNSMGELDAAKAQTELLAPELEKITCDVVVVHGTIDELVPYANTKYIQRMLKNAKSLRTVTLPKQGHFVPWERPDAIRAAVESIVSKP